MNPSTVFANPPFDMKSWGGEHLRPACRACGAGREDKRWKFGVPPGGNANFAWVQHMIHHLAPAGLAGFVLEGGSMCSLPVRARSDTGGEPVEEKMNRLVAQLRAQQAEAEKLDAASAADVALIGYSSIEEGRDDR